MLRIYLSGRVALDGPGGRLEASSFPGRQGRELFSFLVMSRGAPTSRSMLADALWGETLPASWDTALSSIVSKLRVQLSRVGLDGANAVTSADGCYQLRLPPNTWIDHDTAFASIHQAEAALKEGDFRVAYGPSAVARLICARPFLPGSDAGWVEERRSKLKSSLVRALECRSAIYLWNSEFTLAAESAREAISIEPFQESSHRHLMRAHDAAGNAAEAVRAYERCRSLISEELGVPPSPETQRLYSEIVRAL